ncbi:MAG: NADP-dependent oxidoreductase [Bacteroidales bacterium]|nr:NADP-dependent oxidoreductase [Bacteroidales bacterium]
MQAAVIKAFGTPECFSIEDIPIPEVKPGKLLIKNFASSINPVDYKHLKGNHKWLLGAPFPIVLGYDVAGVVKEAGLGCTKYRPGDRVMGRVSNKYGGALAQYVLATEQELTLIPNNVPFENAGCLPLAGLTAYQGLIKAGLQAGHHVLIVGGSGGVGHFAIQIANMLKATVTSYNSTRHNNFVKSLQAAEIINYDTQQALPVNKFNAILDCSGKYTILQMHKQLKKGGVFVTLLPRPSLVRHKLFALFRGKRVKTFLMQANGNQLSVLAKWLEHGDLQVSIMQQFNISDIKQAYNLALNSHIQGKIGIAITANA